MTFIRSHSNVYFFLVTASEPAKAKFVDQDDLENRPFHPSKKLYTDQEGVRQRLEKSWMKTRFIRHERKSKLDDVGSKSKQPIKNLAATNEEIGREFILVLVSKPFSYYMFLVGEDRLTSDICSSCILSET